MISVLCLASWHIWYYHTVPYKVPLLPYSFQMATPLFSFSFSFFLAVLGLHCGMQASLCRTQAPEHAGSIVVAHRLSCPSMWDLSSPTRDWTHVPCIGRQILNHWTTRQVLDGCPLTNSIYPKSVPSPRCLKRPSSHATFIHGFS